jgi:hypothetical protein
MKKITLISTLFFLFLTVGLQSQIPPNGFNYSAVARGPQGQPISNQNIGIRFSILKTTATGLAQYVETHQTTTDATGLFNLIIGGGAVQSGSFSAIDWSSDNFFLKVELDAQGGINYYNMGTTQLLSVPYALYAKSAGSVNGAGGGGNFTHYIGEEYGGGVIFHLWKDNAGVEHGLIVDKTDLSTAQPWSNMDTVLIGPAAQSGWDGLSNSNAIVGQTGHTNSAAALCLNSTNGGQSDWYLPSILELSMLWNNYCDVSRSLSQIAGATLMSYQNNYWSSTEFNDWRSWFQAFDGTAFHDLKSFNLTHSVRAVRTF